MARTRSSAGSALRSGRQREGGRERGRRREEPPPARPPSTGRDRRRGRGTAPTPRRTEGPTAARANRRGGGEDAKSTAEATAEPEGDAPPDSIDTSHAPTMGGGSKDEDDEKNDLEIPFEEGEKKHDSSDSRRKGDDGEREEEEEEPKMDTSHAPKKAKDEDKRKEERGESKTVELPLDDGEKDRIGGSKRKRENDARGEEEGSGEEGSGTDRGDDSDADSRAESNVEVRLIQKSVTDATCAPKMVQGENEEKEGGVESAAKGMTSEDDAGDCGGGGGEWDVSKVEDGGEKERPTKTTPVKGRKPSGNGKVGLRKRMEADTKVGQTPRDTILGSHPMKDITTPGINDFLLNRSPVWNVHTGNTVFRDLVNARKRAFIAAGGKRLVAEEVVKEWRSRDPPGRFLLYDPVSGLSRDVGDEQAINKVRKMLWDAVLEYSAEKGFIAAIPPAPPAGAAQPSEGKTGARTGRRKEKAPPRKRKKAGAKVGQTPRDTMPGSRPMEGITTPGINDFLLSWGTSWDPHFDNAIFIALVKKRKDAYLAASKPAAKWLVRREIIQEWRSRDPPGRFLTYDKRSSTWRDVGDEEAGAKVGQMLWDSIYECSVEKGIVSEVPPEPPAGVARPSEGETGASMGRRKEEAPPGKREKVGAKVGQMPRDTVPGSRPWGGITTPGINDFLLSWGTPWDAHPDNAVFHALVKKRKGAYLGVSKPAAKWLVRREVVEEWRLQDPPGRFLTYDKRSRTWRDVGDEEAGAKVGQMLWDSIYENVEKGAAVPPEPPAGVAQPSGGETGVHTKESLVMDLINSDNENEDDATLDEAMFSRLMKLHQSMLRGELAPKQMARAIDFQMKAIRQQREDIVRKDAGIAKLNDLHNEMVAEKDALISRMENEINNFTQEEVQEQAAGQLPNLLTMKLQMCTIDRQEQRINLQVREAIELSKRLKATTKEKDQEIRRLRDEVAKAKGEGKGVKDGADREDSKSKGGVIYF